MLISVKKRKAQKTKTDMTIRQLISRGANLIRPRSTSPLSDEVMSRLRIDPLERDAVASQTSGALAKIFFEHRGRILWKWVHYLEIYDRHFAQYRNTSVKMLEIGVFKGGSLDMWREYFGRSATVFGIDIDPKCIDYATEPNQVRIGSQDDPEFLKNVVLEMGIPDIVLDDGSHLGRHQRKSFEILFPLLKPGALYVIEDLHSSYWGGQFEGGYGEKGTIIQYIKQMIDDMHAWYHDSPVITPAKTDVGAIHLYDSIVFVEKRPRQQPGHIQVN